MRLENILADLQGDVTPLEVVQSTEASRVEPRFVVSAEALSTEDVNKASQYTSLLRFKKQVDTLPLVDVALALEVFTMLGAEGKGELAKFSSAPSLMNKEILSRVISTKVTGFNSLADDLQGKIYIIIEDIKGSQEKTLALLDYAKELTARLTHHHNRLSSQPPLVMLCGRTHNLYTTSVSSLAYGLPDSEMQYAPYKGVLNKAFIAFYNQVSYDMLRQWLRIDVKEADASLSDFVVELLSLPQVLQEIMNYQQEVIIRCDSYKATSELYVNEHLIQSVEDTNTLYSDLLRVKELHGIKTIPDNAIEKLLEVLTRID